MRATKVMYVMYVYDYRSCYVMVSKGGPRVSAGGLACPRAERWRYNIYDHMMYVNTRACRWRDGGSRESARGGPLEDHEAVKGGPPEDGNPA